MATTTRTIEQILDTHRRAAENRVVERAAAAAKMQQQVDQAIVKTDREQDLVELLNALRVAREALTLANQEIASQQGRDVEPVTYSPSTSQTLDRYAGVLMLDDPELDLEAARAQSRADEQARFQDYTARFHPDTLEDDEDDDYEV